MGTYSPTFSWALEWQPGPQKKDKGIPLADLFEREAKEAGKARERIDYLMKTTKVVMAK